MALRPLVESTNFDFVPYVAYFMLVTRLFSVAMCEA